jgi:hypothetical protein
MYFWVTNADLFTGKSLLRKVGLRLKSGSEESSRQSPKDLRLSKHDFSALDLTLLLNEALRIYQAH